MQAQATVPNNANSNVASILAGAQALNDAPAATAAPATAANADYTVGANPTVIPRVDLYGNLVVFFADSENKDDKSIVMWDGKKGTKIKRASMQVYHTSKTAPKEIAEEVGKRFMKEFGIKTAVIRQRRFREGKVQMDGMIEKQDASDIKGKLLSAIDQFSNTMRQYVEDSFKSQ